MTKKIEIQKADTSDLLIELIDEQCVTNVMLEEIRHLLATNALVLGRIYDRIAPREGEKTYEEVQDIVTHSYQRIRAMETEETGPAEQEDITRGDKGVAA